MRIGIPKETLFEEKRVVLAPAGVVTSRGDVHYVITEYGVAILFGKSIKERVQELIKISHPKFRNELTEYAKDTYNI